MCVICLSDENLDTVTLCCCNIVHKLCLNNWLRVNEKCPICRNEHIKDLLQDISQETQHKQRKTRTTSQKQTRTRTQRQQKTIQRQINTRTQRQHITIEITYDLLVNILN